MRIFITISKTINGECHAHFFVNLSDANKFAFEQWMGLCPEERLDTLISVYWIDLSSLFNNFDDRRCEKLNYDANDSCFSSRELIANAWNAYHEYPSMFFAALDGLVNLIGGDTGQTLKDECTEAYLALSKVYLNVLKAVGTPLWLLEKS